MKARCYRSVVHGKNPCASLRHLEASQIEAAFRGGWAAVFTAPANPLALSNQLMKLRSVRASRSSLLSAFSQTERPQGTGGVDLEVKE
jgi:hypothetical protein